MKNEKESEKARNKIIKIKKCNTRHTTFEREINTEIKIEIENKITDILTI